MGEFTRCAIEARLHIQLQQIVLRKKPMASIIAVLLQLQELYYALIQVPVNGEIVPLCCKRKIRKSGVP